MRVKKTASTSAPILSIGLSESGKAIVLNVLAPYVLYDYRPVQQVTFYPVDLDRRTLGKGHTHRAYFLMPLRELQDDGFFPGHDIEDIFNLIKPLLKYRVPEAAAKAKATTKASPAKKSPNKKTVKLTPAAKVAPATKNGKAKAAFVLP